MKTLLITAIVALLLTGCGSESRLPKPAQMTQQEIRVELIRAKLLLESDGRYEVTID